MKRFIFSLLLLGFLALVLSACGQQAEAAPSPTATPPTTSHGGPVQDYVSLIDQLRAHGATVDPAGDVSQPFFSVSGHIITVNGEHVQVYEYATDDAANAEAARISPDGGTIGNTIVDWVAPPHFYKAGKIIVLYVGNTAHVLQPLFAVLGSQFAGSSS